MLSACVFEGGVFLLDKLKMLDDLEVLSNPVIFTQVTKELQVHTKWR